MTTGVVVLLLGLIATGVVLFARAYGISSWLLFGAACGLTALIGAVAVAVASTSCAESDAWSGMGVPFVFSVGASLTLYAGAALGSIVSGFRIGASQGVGKAVSRFVVCPLLSVVGAGVVFYAAIVALFHCFELTW